MKNNNQSLDLQIDNNGVANLTINLIDEKVNKLSSSIIGDLEKAINIIDGNKAIRLLIITSGKENNFIAGADINEIAEIIDYKQAIDKVKRGQDIINRISRLKIPTIALINGSCLGGGLELAMACNYRIGIKNDKTILGLPEVNLGIIPGFGGTQRMPLIIGLEAALDLIISAKSIDIYKAIKIGLIDAIINKEFLEVELSKIVSEILANPSNNSLIINRNKSKKFNKRIEKIPLSKHLIKFFTAKKIISKTKNNYPAPIVALNTIMATYPSKLSNKDFNIELENFCNLVIGKEAKNLIKVFFMLEKAKKGKDIIGDNFITPKITNATVVGAGTMGGGIAWLLANNNIAVRLQDVSYKPIAIGYSQIFKIFSQMYKKKKIIQSEIDRKFNNVQYNLDYQGINNSQLIIEAVIEDIAIKKKVLEKIENNTQNSSIIVSNTSSLEIDNMSSVLTRPENFAGMHFFNPVDKMPLVEIIPHSKTSEETIKKIAAISIKLGKIPIIVKQTPGFLVNRILIPYICQAFYLLQEGCLIEDIDKAILDFGMPMGPFELSDVVGIDIGAKVAKVLEKSFDSHMKTPEILDEISSNIKFGGKKSGVGMYCYDKKGNKKSINIEIYKIVDFVKKNSNIASIKSSKTEIIDRCILQMVNEAARCIEEKIVNNAEELDLAMIIGTGFPPFQGGLLKYADNRGIANIVSTLQQLAIKYKLPIHPCQYLIKMAENNRKFYDKS